VQQNIGHRNASITVPHNAAPHKAVPHNSVSHNAVSQNSVSHNAVPHNAVRQNESRLSHLLGTLLSSFGRSLSPATSGTRSAGVASLLIHRSVNTLLIHSSGNVRMVTLILAVAALIATGPGSVSAFQQPRPNPGQAAQPGQVRKTAPVVRPAKAIVVDDRLSALRRQPDLLSTVLRRLHVGHKVWIVAERKATADQPHFYRVAVTRRTSGWIHAAALIAPARPGEDQRFAKLISDSMDGFERAMRARLFVQYFPRSPLVPGMLLTMGEEAERAARSLAPKSTRRIAKKETQHIDATERDYYLSDAGLDRYSRIGISFDFNTTTDEYVYDGRAYRELIARYPKSDAAEIARKRLDNVGRKLATRH